MINISLYKKHNYLVFLNYFQKYFPMIARLWLKEYLCMFLF